MYPPRGPSDFHYAKFSPSSDVPAFHNNTILEGSSIETSQPFFHSNDHAEHPNQGIDKQQLPGSYDAEKQFIMATEPGQNAVLSISNDAAKVTVGEVCVIAKEGRRYCLCEAYRKHQKAGKFYSCNFCGEIWCNTCLGNPEHHVDYKKPITSDLAAADKNKARRDAVRTFPAHIFLGLSPVSSSARRSPFPSILRPHLEALYAAAKMCACDVHYYQTNIKFRDDLTVTYEAKNSHIEVVATATSVTWSVYLLGDFFDASHIKDPRQALRDLGYDFRKPVMRAELTDLHATFIPTMND